MKRLNRKQGKFRWENNVAFLMIMIFITTGIGMMIVVWNLPQVNHDLLLDAATLRTRYLDSVHISHNINSGPLLDEDEQLILSAAKDELNQFPVMIGIDDKNNQNSNWETIMHPGTEALVAIHGESYLKKSRRKPTPAQLAQLLSEVKPGQNNVNTNDGERSETTGIDEGYIRVPKFWDPPVYGVIADERELRGEKPPKDLPRDGVRRYLGNYGSRLMTPSEAKSIGSRIPSQDDGEETLETIFIAIASYRDWQCSKTIESAFLRARHPERLRVGVVDQIKFGKDEPCSKPPNGSCEENPNQPICIYKEQIDFLTIDASLSVGPVFARHLGHRLYRGEYFAAQIDAHVSFVEGWDDEIIGQWHTAKNEMAVLTAYVSTVEGHIDIKTGKRLSKARPIMCESDFEGNGNMKHLQHGQQPEGIPYIHDMPTIEPFFGAGFSFSRGHFVVNVPYDQRLPWVFQGEEISIGLRGFSYGYDFYTAELQACYHFYGRKKAPPLFWENAKTYQGAAHLGMNRLNSIIHMQPESEKNQQWIHTDELKYGIGQVRQVDVFFETFGIHIASQTVEHHLCTFVGRPMQQKFIPHLRTNGMGINYAELSDFKFVDPRPTER